MKAEIQKEEKQERRHFLVSSLNLKNIKHFLIIQLSFSLEKSLWCRG